MTSTLTITKLYDLLSQKVGKEAAESLTVYIQEQVGAQVEGEKSGIVNEIKLELEKTKVEVEKTMRNQMWVIIALFIPMYISILILILNIIKK